MWCVIQNKIIQIIIYLRRLKKQIKVFRLIYLVISTATFVIAISFLHFYLNLDF